MPVEMRKVVTHDDAKTFIPLAEHFRAMGYEVRREASVAGSINPDQVLVHFSCFYATLRHPLRAFLRFRAMRRQGIPVITWNRDAPHYLNHRPWRLALLEKLRLFDLYATHSIIDGRRFGAEQFYLGNAASNRYFLVDAANAMRRLRRSDGYAFDVSFFGAMSGARFKEMRARETFFSELGRRLVARGIRFIFREAEGMSYEQQIELIQSSRINLNFGAACDYGAPLASGMPERCYGIPACGGFLLCDKRTHARDDFTPGENWAEFEGLDDCVAKIEFWLENYSAARDLAERCHAHVMAHHTYALRAQLLRDRLLAWHASRQEPRR
ncbi:MAG: glycosyltransferase [Sulfuritalea sp.]|nr:glycosyltransferase [Sulfuritalea sp.]